MEINIERTDSLENRDDMIQIGTTDVEKIVLVLYKNACTDAGREGTFHLFAQLTDKRNPHQPIIINTLPIITKNGPEDGHYTQEQLDSELPDALGDFREARNIAGGHAEFVRGLYGAATIGMLNSQLEMIAPVIDTLRSNGLIEDEDLGGSQDSEIPDIFGGLDLNTILQ